MASDSLLDSLHHIGDGVVASIGVSVTVLTAGARIEGTIARAAAFAERFDSDMADAMRRAATELDDAGKRMVIEAIAKTFDAQPTYTNANRRTERRRQLDTELDELAADDPRRGELEAEQARLDKSSSVLVLSEPKIWTYGFNPMQGPLTPPFVRIDVASITAWWHDTS
jgi:hypothetical protein